MSFQCLISTLTQGGEGGHLFRLTCSVVLWQGWGEENCKQISLVCVGNAQCVWATLGLPLFTTCVLSHSTLLRLQVALQGNCLKQALGCMHCPGLSHSGSGSGTPQRHRQCWAGILCPSQVRAAQATRCLASALSPGGQCVLSPPLSQPLSFLDAQRECHLWCVTCLLWGADLWLRPSW